MSSSSMIEIEALTKRYGSFVAVDNISLQVEPGEIFCFLGMNGAGKTTTLRMMTGILRPTAGSVRIGGFDINSEPLKAKNLIGYIPDRPHIYGKLTGKEFLYFVADLYHMAADDAEKNINFVLSQFGLLDWQHELVEGYSHGMKQRLATCAALVHKPKVLIIDEPMVGLDPQGAKLFKEVMMEYAERDQIAIFLSTHSLNVAEELADRLAIIHEGSIISQGTIGELRDQVGGVNETLENLFLSITSFMAH